MYNGPSGSPQSNPLLPDDFDLDNDNSDNDQSQSDNDNNSTEVSWKDAKSYMAKLASGQYKNKGRAVSNHIKAYGGSKAASMTAKAGVNTIISLGSFANTASSSNLKNALEAYNIDYSNKTPKEVLNELTNLIAPIPITKDDSIARKALIVTLEYIYELFEKENLDYETIDPKLFNLMVPKYIENYIYERIINDLGSRIEEKSKSCQEAINLENELKEYINAKVDVAFKDKDFSKVDFNSPTIKKEVESMINQCYTIMEE